MSTKYDFIFSLIVYTRSPRWWRAPLFFLDYCGQQNDQLRILAFNESCATTFAQYVTPFCLTALCSKGQCILARRAYCLQCMYLNAP